MTGLKGESRNRRRSGLGCAGLGGKACLALEYLCNRYYMSNFFPWSSSADDSLLPLTPRQLAGKD